MNTELTIINDKFIINGALTYSEIPGCPEKNHGLLMNARFIQGVFDDKANPERFARFGWETWDPERNTDDLIKALPAWYAAGLRAITVGFQGGMPVLTIDNSTIDCNPFSPDGKEIEPAYLDRMDRIIKAADKIGMIIIVSILYQGQAPRMGHGIAVLESVRTASTWLKDQGYTNVIIEVANEHTICAFEERPLVSSADGMAALIQIAREASGGMPVGCSDGGLMIKEEVARASDVILMHGNSGGRQNYYRFIKKIQSWGLNKPILCNEDSPCFTRLDIAFDTGTSWGYYNTHTKQEPPGQWAMVNEEDLFFARRMSRGLGIPVGELPEEERYVLLGLNDFLVHEGKRWIRLAAEEPETVKYVEYYKNGSFLDRAYEEPFYVNYQDTWMHEGTAIGVGDEVRAVIYLIDGRVLERTEIQSVSEY